MALPSLTGCHVLRQAKQTTKYEHHQFPYFLERHLSYRQYRSWAGEAWSSTYAGVAGDSNTADFRRGFFDGFADFCYAGGTGQPPLVPPRQFWSILYRNRAGDERIADWRRGFRLGAQAANEGGYRRRAVVPVALFMNESDDATGSMVEQWGDDEQWGDAESWDDDDDLEVLPDPTDEPAGIDESGVIIDAPAPELNGAAIHRTSAGVPNSMGSVLRTAGRRGGASR